MGAQLVGAAFSAAARLGLKPNEARLLVWMALHALDADARPLYFGARESSAIGLGRIIPDEPDPDDPRAEQITNERLAAFKAIRIATRDLANTGVIKNKKHGREGQRAEWWLKLDMGITTASADNGCTENVSLEKTENVSLNRRKTYTRAYEKRLPKEPLQEPLKELHRGQHHDPALTHVGYPQASKKDQLRVAS